MGGVEQGYAGGIGKGGVLNVASHVVFIAVLQDVDICKDGLARLGGPCSIASLSILTLRSVSDASRICSGQDQ